MPESAEELRAMVLSDFCLQHGPAPTCGEECDDVRPPLYDRAPSLRPGRDFHYAGPYRCFYYTDEHGRSVAVLPAHARALIRDPLAVALAKAWRGEDQPTRIMLAADVMCALASDSVAELVKLHHKMLDSKETPDA
jgi:hypothetical protein